MITIPQYYAESWGNEIMNMHNKYNFKWEVQINYFSPKEFEEKSKI